MAAAIGLLLSFRRAPPIAKAQNPLTIHVVAPTGRDRTYTIQVRDFIAR